MSEDIEFSERRAKIYNSRSKYRIPAIILEKYPALNKGRDGETFLEGVFQLQKNLGFEGIELDGMFGYQTYTKMLERYVPVKSEYIINKGERIQLPKRSEYELITFDEPKGFNLHRFGNFSQRKEEKIEGITFHWGGLNPAHCYRVFASSSRKVSSHFLIGLMNGVPTVYQVLDLSLKAWHGGKVNEWTVGIDICQSPVLKFEEYYKKEGYQICQMKNKTGRGSDICLSLDPRIRAATKTFLDDLLFALELDEIIPMEHKVFSTPLLKEFTVIGHHHVASSKYDIAPWWDDIFS
tara:strand:- start:1639 stop:2520 length:882 start_codon:yes stop_codon:yes gene_type:complete